MAISSSFLAAAKKSVFNSSEWKATGPAYSLKEIWDITDPGLYEEIAGDTAEVTSTEFSDGSTALRIVIPFKDGTQIELKLSGRSDLEEGDKVLIESITGQELRKVGQDPIVRYDGKAA